MGLRTIFENIKSGLGVTADEPLNRFAPANDNNPKALVIIDMQVQYCDARRKGNDKTEALATRLETLVPKFRAAGLAIYHVYYDIKGLPELGGFYKVHPTEGDIKIAKNDDSAFAGSDIDHVLKANGHRNIYVCGVNRSFCVRSTVLDGRQRGYEITVLRDLVANGKCIVPMFSAGGDWVDFVEQGVRIEHSNTALNRVTAAKSLSLK